MELKLIFSGVVAVAIAAAGNFVYRLQKHRRMFKGLPGPPHSFFWGHLQAIGEVAATMPPNIHPNFLFAEIAKKYNLKGLYYLDMWPVSFAYVILTSPDLMDKVQVSRSFPKHPSTESFLVPFIGENVIPAVNGPVWKQLHNAMAPAFSWSHVRNLTGVMIDECTTWRQTLDRYAETGQVIQLDVELPKLVFDIVGRLVFNFNTNAQTTGSPYLNDIQEIVHLLEVAFSMNPISKLIASLKRGFVRRRLDAMVQTKIKERFDLLVRESIVPSRRAPLSVLDLMLRDNVLAGESATKESSHAQLSPKQLQLLTNNIKGLLLGGQGTTNVSLNFTFMLLATHPEVLEKLREEHSRVFAPGYNATLQILEDSPSKLTELTYTTAVINESLRLFPVGAFGVYGAPEGATLNYEGTDHPFHDWVVVNLPTAPHYDPELFEKPTKFIPERFLDDKVPRSHFRTFSRGPRACLGQSLAMDIMRVTLLSTVRDYNFELIDYTPNAKPRIEHTDLDTVFGDMIFSAVNFEAKPRGGVKMNVTKTNAAL